MKTFQHNLLPIGHFQRFLEQLICVYPIPFNNQILSNFPTSYFGASKSVFFERINYIFNQYELSHDPHPPEIIQSKKNPNAFKLRFKKLRESIKFIIEESDGKIIRIYNNKKADTKDEVDMLSPFDMVFGDDEKPDFNPDVDYLINHKKSRIAVQYVDGDKKQVFNSAVLKMWLSEYEDLNDYTSAYFKYFIFRPFVDLYFGIGEIIGPLNELEIVRQANNDHKQLNLDKWLEKYNRLFYCNLANYDQLFHKIDFEKQLVQYSIHSNLWVTGDDIFELIKFSRLYYNTIELSKALNN